MSGTTPDSRDRLDSLLRRQDQERSDLVAELLDEERTAASAIANDLHPGAGARLAEALAAVERQLRTDHRADRLLARVVTELPAFVDAHFPSTDPDDERAGRRAVNVYIARRYGSGHIEPLAVAVLDVSDAIYGRGSRRRRDERLAVDQQAEAARDAEIQRDRERAAARR